MTERRKTRHRRTDDGDAPTTAPTPPQLPPGSSDDGLTSVPVRRPADKARREADTQKRDSAPAGDARLNALLDVVCRAERALAFVMLTDGFSHGTALLYGFREMFQRIAEFGDRHFLRQLVRKYEESSAGAPAELDALAVQDLIPQIRKLYDTIGGHPFSGFDAADPLDRLRVGDRLARALTADYRRLRASLAHFRRALLWRLKLPTRRAMEYPEAQVAPLLAFARHMSTDMLDRAQALGEDVFRHAISSRETVAVVGRTVGANEMQLYAQPRLFRQFSVDFHDRIVATALGRHGVVQSVSPSGFIVLFPLGVKINDHPLKAAFEFVRMAISATRHTLGQWARRLRFRPLSHPDTPDAQSPEPGGTDDPLGVAIGVDIGPVDYTHHLGRLLMAGQAVERARRCADAEPGSVVVNAAVRWMVARERRDPSSPLYFEDYPLIFRDHPVRSGDGNDFLAFRVLETPHSGREMAAAAAGEVPGTERTPTDPKMPQAPAGAIFGSSTAVMHRSELRKHEMTGRSRMTASDRIAREEMAAREAAASGETHDTGPIPASDRIARTSDSGTDIPRRADHSDVDIDPDQHIVMPPDALDSGDQ